MKALVMTVLLPLVSASLLEDSLAFLSEKVPIPVLSGLAEQKLQSGHPTASGRRRLASTFKECCQESDGCSWDSAVGGACVSQEKASENWGEQDAWKMCSSEEKVQGCPGGAFAVYGEYAAFSVVCLVLSVVGWWLLLSTCGCVKREKLFCLKVVRWKDLNGLGKVWFGLFAPITFVGLLCVFIALMIVVNYASALYHLPCSYEHGSYGYDGGKCFSDADAGAQHCGWGCVLVLYFGCIGFAVGMIAMVFVRCCCIEKKQDTQAV